MSLVDQMKLPCLINVGLILILVSGSEGGNWKITLPQRQIKTTPGSTVNIPCSFTYPDEQKTDNVQVYWKKPGTSSFNFKDNDINAFIYRANDKFVEEMYKGRTKLIGDPNEGNCSLAIQNINQTESNIYVRVVGKNNQYSFKNEFVSIFLDDVKTVTLGPDVTISPISTQETTTIAESNKDPPSLSMYLAIFIPVAAILVICIITGIVCCVKRKRSKSFTREESGYYVNFSRAPSDPAKREEPSKKLDDKPLAQPKAIDDPVYINYEAPSGPMDQGMAHTENLYGNVDYS